MAQTEFFSFSAIRCAAPWAFTHNLPPPPGAFARLSGGRRAARVRSVQQLRELLLSIGEAPSEPELEKLMQRVGYVDRQVLDWCGLL